MLDRCDEWSFTTEISTIQFTVFMSRSAPLDFHFQSHPFFQIYLSRKRKHLFIEFLLWEIIKVIVSNLLKNVIKFYFQNNILILIKISKKADVSSAQKRIQFHE